MRHRFEFIIDTFSKIPVELHRFLRHNIKYFEKISNCREFFKRWGQEPYHYKGIQGGNEIPQIDELRTLIISLVEPLAELLDCVNWLSIPSSFPYIC